MGKLTKDRRLVALVEEVYYCLTFGFIHGLGKKSIFLFYYGIKQKL